MRAYRKLGSGLLAAFALGVVPAAAQDVAGAPLPDTAAMTLVFVVFPDEGAAQQALTDLNKTDTTASDQLASYAVVSKDQAGKVKVQESSAKKGKSTSARADQAIDGVVALLGQPRTNNQTTGDTTGTQTSVSAQDMSKMQDMLTAGTSALIVIVPEPAADDLATSIGQPEAQVVEADLPPPQP
jgi:uncharacterized membrane protein